jgi:hypothetical protein
MGPAVMTNNQVISITAGVRKRKGRRLAVGAVKGLQGIEVHAQLIPDSAAAWFEPSRRLEEEEIEKMEKQNEAVDRGIRLSGCSDPEEGGRTYWIGTDDSMNVLGAPAEKPADAAVSFATFEELMMGTSHWRMAQLVSVWNKLGSARQLTRFENRRIGVERLWRAIEQLPSNLTAGKVKSQAKNRRGQSKSGGQSKSERIIGLLRAPGGTTLTTLMEATGWQAHSVRGFLSGKLSKQLGLRVESIRREGQRVYALAPTTIEEGATGMMDAAEDAAPNGGTD